MRLLFHFRLCSLKLNKGNSDINNRDRITERTERNMALLMQGKSETMKGRDNIIKAFAGVGNPIKEEVWRLSMLNLANRKADSMGISSAVYLRCGMSEPAKRLNMMQAGAT